MAGTDRPRVIALEEHYWDSEVEKHFKGRNASRRNALLDRLHDLGELRLKEMDEAGVDVQVLSHGAPSLQCVAADEAVDLAREANDRLAEACKANPDRLFGFAALPTADPKAAADELERCVDKLGFKGAMIHGPTLTDGWLDKKEYWPIFERAQAVDAPLYLHPSYPHPDILKTYFADYLDKFPGFATAGWGYTIETATHAIRIVLSGVFDKYPGAKMILGHLGESIPFSLWRVNQALSRVENTGDASFRDIFCDRFWITTSGNFSNPALLCCVMELGIDRILFSIDYPFVENPDGTDWIGTIPLGKEDVNKLLHGNAERLLKM
jgi:predicted TIM-barrel fold metal-dependent hydrolase